MVVLSTRQVFSRDGYFCNTNLSSPYIFSFFSLDYDAVHHKNIFIYIICDIK
jgi:hypothetical protein